MNYVTLLVSQNKVKIPPNIIDIWDSALMLAPKMATLRWCVDGAVVWVVLDQTVAQTVHWCI